MKIKNVYLKASVLLGLLMLPVISAFADTTSQADVSQLPTILSQNFHYCADILQGFSITAGIAMLILGIHGFKTHAERKGMMMQQQNGLMPHVVKLFCATILISPALWLNTLLLAILGNASPESNPFTSIMSDEFASSLSWAVIQGINVLGIGVFIKGVFVLSKAGSPNAQHGNIGKAITHFVGGICLVHIVTVTETVYTFIFGSSTIF